MVILATGLTLCGCSSFDIDGTSETLAQSGLFDPDSSPVDSSNQDDTTNNKHQTAAQDKAAVRK